MRKVRVGTQAVFVVALALLLVMGAWSATTTQQPASVKPQMVDLELKNVPVQQAIDKLFDGTGLKYTVDPAVTGKVVELRLKGITFKQALDSLAEAAGFTYKLTDGVYAISPVGTAAVSYTPAPKADNAPDQVIAPETQPAAQPQSVQQPAPTQVFVNQENNGSPIYYGQPNYGPEPYYAYPPGYSVGVVSVLGRGYYWPPVIVAGYQSVTRHEVPGPPPPGFVGPDVQRFLRGQYAIRSRTVIVPAY